MRYIGVISALLITSLFWTTQGVLAWHCPPGVPDTTENELNHKCVDVTPVPTVVPTNVPTSTGTLVTIIVPPSNTGSTSPSGQETVRICHYDTQQGWMIEVKNAGHGYNDLPYGQPSLDNPLGDYRVVSGGVCATPTSVPLASVTATSVPVFVPLVPLAESTPVPTVVVTETPVSVIVPTATPTDAPNDTPVDTSEATPTVVSPPIQIPVHLPVTGDGSTFDWNTSDELAP